jgi:lipopolysaccharide export system permease protein
MILLHRHILRSFVRPFIFCSVFFLAMFIVVDVLNQLDEFLVSGANAGVIALYYASMVPLILAQVLPAAVLLAALYALGLLNRHNEITAMKSNGVSGFRILQPVFLAGLVISFALFAMNETVTPQATVASSSIKYGLIKKKSSDMSERSVQNVALLTDRHRMVYAREMMIGTRSMYDVIILEHRSDMTLKSKTTARSGVYLNGSWILYDVLEYDVDERGAVTDRPRTLERKEIDLKESPEAFLTQYAQPEHMSYWNLRRYIKGTRITGYRASNRLLVELHEKLSGPFVCLVMLLVSAPLALISRRGGAMLSIGVGLLVIVVFYSFGAVSSALGKGGILPPFIAAWLPNASFGLLGLYLIRRNV